MLGRNYRGIGRHSLVWLVVALAYIAIAAALIAWLGLWVGFAFFDRSPPQLELALLADQPALVVQANASEPVQLALLAKLDNESVLMVRTVNYSKQHKLSTVLPAGSTAIMALAYDRGGNVARLELNLTT